MVSGTIRLVNLFEAKAPLPIVFTLLGKSIDINLLFSKDLPPIISTLFKLTLVKPVFLKAL